MSGALMFTYVDIKDMEKKDNHDQTYDPLFVTWISDLRCRTPGQRVLNNHPEANSELNKKVLIEVDMFLSSNYSNN